MLNKIEANELLDIYGELLTQRQQEIAAFYYQEDYSYFEIAENLQISRAAVQDTISRVDAVLKKYEAAIGYNKKRKEILALCKAKDWEKIPTIL
ncbi:YlxM family DNA-binding protein [Catenisphaera adipataccumulans]|jgi:predicted DNA-binding protein YlxM (UPF0122 family)|uniref:Uncharacterized protein n=1 Tax=Catenisphaera adipataccumulans TaxID=700500 RepID=A0A7W8FVS4_9FIRM|nr:hypothetical protein [Catenisphaera adipataccumulans]MBB5183909.1 hypothetical protein [Catenisphaera adipataccumulans]